MRQLHSVHLRLRLVPKEQPDPGTCEHIEQESLGRSGQRAEELRSFRGVGRIQRLEPGSKRKKSNDVPDYFLVELSTVAIGPSVGPQGAPLAMSQVH